MKSIKKIRLNDFLKSQELIHLKGMGHNTNLTAECKCTYYNGSGATTNSDFALGCSCVCVY